jgi:hypothetical protein
MRLILRIFNGLLLILAIVVMVPTMASDEFLLLLGGKVDRVIFEGYSKSPVLSENLEVGVSYYIQTVGASGTDPCSDYLENNQFIVLTFTGVGQTTDVYGVCGPYVTSETLTVSGANYLTTTVGHSYDVGVVRVLRLR